MEKDATKQQSCFSSCDVSAYHQTNQPREVFARGDRQKKLFRFLPGENLRCRFSNIIQLPLSILILLLGFDKRSAENFGGGYYLGHMPPFRRVEQETISVWQKTRFKCARVKQKADHSTGPNRRTGHSARWQ